MKCHIYYHADLDGFASGAIAVLGLRHKCNYHPSVDTIILHKIQYGDPFDPDHLIDYEKDDIIMVDFMLQEGEQMLKLIEYENFIWIDHHQSSLDFVKKHQIKLGKNIWVDISQAACELTWRYFFNQEVPLAVRLISHYDMWKKGPGSEFDWETKILPHQIQLMSISKNTDPQEEGSWIWWESYLSPAGDLPQVYTWADHQTHVGKVQEVINKGRELVSFQEGMYRDISLANAYEATFLGKYKAICLNSPIQNSRMFEVAYDVSQYDLMVIYIFNGEKWRVSLYTVQEDIACNELATQLGQEGPYKSGGGHAKAAGFLTDFELLSSYIKKVNQ